MREQVQKTTPLKRWRKQIEEQLPECNVIIFAMRGSTWLVMSRRRVYMVLVHKKAGKVATARIKMMLKEMVGQRMQQPRCNSQNINYNCHNELVQGNNHYWQSKRPHAVI